jgi:hypothetical protein
MSEDIQHLSNQVVDLAIILFDEGEFDHPEFEDLTPLLKRVILLRDAELVKRVTRKQS